MMESGSGLDVGDSLFVVLEVKLMMRGNEKGW